MNFVRDCVGTESRPRKYCSSRLRIGKKYLQCMPFFQNKLTKNKFSDQIYLITDFPMFPLV